MSNICLIKVSGDRILSQWRNDQDYDNFDQAALDILADSNEVHGDSRTMEGYACADTNILKVAVDGGALLCDGPACDFDVKPKSAVTSETIIPPFGVEVEDIPDADFVVCYV